jgi:DNA-binding CsgD family transcriptional regulator
MKVHLTQREQEILDLLLAGITPKEIGYKLNISYDTVKYHLKKLYEKLEVNSIQGLFAKFSTKNGRPAILSATSNGVETVFLGLNKAVDSLGSCINVASEIEKINEQHFRTYTLTGEKGVFTHSYAGIVFIPNIPTLEAMKRMTSFSFSVLGDGKTYDAIIGTTDARIEGEENGYRKRLTFKFGEISNINIKINELYQSPHYGKPVPFIQDNIEWFHVGACCVGNFNLKIWDIRFC